MTVHNELWVICGLECPSILLHRAARHLDGATGIEIHTRFWAHSSLINQPGIRYICIYLYM